MHTLFVFLQAEGAPKGGNYTFLIMMAAIFVVMYFLMIRPQKKRQNELQAYR
ncbi:MAG: preprotein translocase subunit YajC, partial [Bacteroidales bacterium]